MWVSSADSEPGGGRFCFQTHPAVAASSGLCWLLAVGLSQQIPAGHGPGVTLVPCLMPRSQHGKCTGHKPLPPCGLGRSSTAPTCWSLEISPWAWPPSRAEAHTIGTPGMGSLGPPQKLPQMLSGSELIWAPVVCSGPHLPFAVCKLHTPLSRGHGSKGPLAAPRANCE